MNENDQKSPSPVTWGERLVLGSLLVTLGILGYAQSAGAQAASVTSMASDAAGQLLPIVFGIGGALIAINVAFFGVRFVLRTVRAGGR